MQGMKYSRVLCSDEVVQMMVWMKKIGGPFLHCDGVRVNSLQVISGVYGGVSDS